MLPDRRGALLRGTLDLLVLASLKNGERYGYELAQHLEAGGLGRVKGGTLYPLLARLEGSDLLAATWRTGEHGPGRRYYTLTPKGRTIFRDEARDWLRFDEAVRSLLTQGGVNMTHEEYMTDLAAQLHALGMDHQRIEQILAEADDHLEQGDDDPVQELGPAREYALRIHGVTVREGAAADAEWQFWAFRADAFAEKNLLDHLGREGWEVLVVRSDAHFACRRHATDPQPWAYRRRTSLRRRRTSDEMEGEGWVACGSWAVFQYFKRPLTATA